MATKKYTFMRVDTNTHNQFKERVRKMNEDLRIMGVKRKLKQIDLVRHLSRRLVFISDRDLVNMTMKRKRKLC